MSKNSKKHIKLEPEWVDLLINLMIGPQLSILVQKYPGLGQELYAKLHSLVNKCFEEHGKTKDDLYIEKASQLVADAYGMNVSSFVQKTFYDGVPKAPTITVVPGNSKIQ